MFNPRQSSKQRPLGDHSRVRMNTIANIDAITVRFQNIVTAATASPQGAARSD
jgi:hypothetical protein